MALQTANLSDSACAFRLPPVQLGPWELLRCQARGNLCQLFQARPAGAANHSPAYAVKVLNDRWNDDDAAIEVMRREAIVGRRVSHPHLVPILSAHVGAAPYFLAMPWLEGATLSKTVAGGRRLSVPAALWVVRQVAEALGGLHLAGWMHADVKPSNIIVSSAGHATLIDLGFARQPADQTSLVDRCVAGTMHYVAPEMITSALRPDIRSDIYSLGATLYELLAGQPPFTARHLAELAEQHRQHEPPDLRMLVPELSPRVSALVHSMLAKEPLRRPQSPRELIGRLAALEVETFRQRSGLSSPLHLSCPLGVSRPESLACPVSIDR